MLMGFIYVITINTETLKIENDFSFLENIYKTYIIDCIFGKNDIDTGLIADVRLKACAHRFLYKILDDDNFEKVSRDQPDKTFVVYHTKEIANFMYKNLCETLNKVFLAKDINMPIKYKSIRKFVILRIKFIHDLLNSFKARPNDLLYVNKIRDYGKSYVSKTILENISSLNNSNITEVFEGRNFLNNSYKKISYDRIEERDIIEENEFSNTFNALFYVSVILMCSYFLYKIFKIILKTYQSFIKKKKIPKADELEEVTDLNNNSNIMADDFNENSNKKSYDVLDNEIYENIVLSTSNNSINKQTSDIEEMIRQCQLICEDLNFK